MSRREIRETYDRIAAHFAQTRDRPWPEVESFIDGRAGGVALDAGCGNGRHAERLADVAPRVVGVDLSRAVLDEAAARAREQGFDLALAQGEATALPLREDCVDLALSVAVIHHLPTRADRVAGLDELARVLASDGAALLSAWSVSHDRFDRERGFDTTVDWTLPDGEVVERFYHIYDMAEFRADLASSRLAVVEAFESSGNCFAVVGKG